MRFLLVILILLVACTVQPEIQVEMKCVRFVKVELWERIGGDIYCYHWVDDNKIEYIQFSSRLTEFKVGECVSMLVKR